MNEAIRDIASLQNFFVKVRGGVRVCVDELLICAFVFCCLVVVVCGFVCFPGFLGFRVFLDGRMGGWKDARDGSKWQRKTLPSGEKQEKRVVPIFLDFFFFFLFCSFVCLFFVVVSDAVSLFLQNVFIIIIPVFMSTKTSNNNNKVSVAKKREFYDPFDFFFGLPMHAMDLSKVRDLDVSSSSSSSSLLLLL